jgi:hypothetical protein
MSFLGTMMALLMRRSIVPITCSVARVANGVDGMQGENEYDNEGEGDAADLARARDEADATEHASNELTEERRRSAAAGVPEEEDEEDSDEDIAIRRPSKRLIHNIMVEEEAGEASDDDDVW